MREAPCSVAKTMVILTWAVFAVGGCADGAGATHLARDAASALDAAVNAPADATNTVSDTRNTVPDTISDTVSDTTNTVPDTISEPLGPPYPIVLAHGMFGFDHLADVEAVPYWFDVPGALEESGEVVFVTEVDPLNDSYVRGRQLLEQVEDIVDETGYAKVNLVGHSQGGLDIRYVAHHRPELVASTVTIATPNNGTSIADIVLKLTDHQKFQELVDAIVRLVGKPLYDEAGDETSLFAPLRNFSEPGIEEFNQRITDQPGVYYASVTGRSDNHGGGLICNTNDAPEFIKRWEYYDDPVTPFLALSEAIIDGGFENHPNDGLVRVDQAMWGDFLGCIPADHLDQVGQLLGDHPGGENAFDHLEFFVDLAAYLHAQGL